MTTDDETTLENRLNASPVGLASASFQADDTGEEVLPRDVHLPVGEVLPDLTESTELQVSLGQHSVAAVTPNASHEGALPSLNALLSREVPEITYVVSLFDVISQGVYSAQIRATWCGWRW